MAEPVIRVPFLLIGKNLVGFPDFLEFLFGFLIPLVFVGVVLNSEFSVGFFDLFRSRGAGDTQDLVIIFLGRHGLGGGWGNGDNAGRSKETIAQFEASTT